MASSSWQGIYRRLRYGEPIVVVSGLPRSGTSMAMKMLEAGGMAVVTDGIRAADEDNPKGYLELERVKNLAEDRDKAWLRTARGKAVKVISFLLRELPEGHNYQVVFMERNVQEVLASQTRMLANRGEDSATSDEEMRRAFESHLWRVRYLLKNEARFAALDLHYKAVLETPREHAERLCDFLRRSLDVDAMVGVVDQALYRNRA